MEPTRGYNFAAGPSMLPESILHEIKDELLDWQHTDRSLLETYHRSDAFKALMHRAEHNLRALLNIPEHYRILFLGAPARSLFSMIPMNFSSESQNAAYIISGFWSLAAYQEANTLANAYVLSGSETGPFLKLPDTSRQAIRNDTSYVYYTPNETINGLRFPSVPFESQISLVADMTSCLLSEPLDINRYALVFAGAQKNIATAGMTLVIVRDDLLERHQAHSLPAMMNLKLQVEHQSLYATPPMFNCYVADKMFQWIKQQGGVAHLYQNNLKKAQKLYDYLDHCEFYDCPVEKSARSLVNVCFHLRDERQNEALIEFARQRKLYNIQGHRKLGGFRASIYNAMPLSGVEKLIECLDDFAKETSF